MKKGSNKAWVYAQCLIWSVEEGYTSESNLKSVINQVKRIQDIIKMMIRYIRTFLK